MSIPRPPQVKDGAQWQRWFDAVYKFLAALPEFKWTNLNFAGSTLTDIQTRNHNDLHNIPEIVGTSGEVEVSNGTGQAGNPTIGLPTVITSPRSFGDGVNQTTFETDGTVKFEGAATVYDDVYPSSVTVGVGATAPSFTAYSGNLKAYEFTGGVSNKEIHIGWQLYHRYKEGSSIAPHLHLFFTSGAADAGKTIIFDLEYEWVNVGDTGAVSTATLTGTYTIGANSTTYKNEIFPFTGTGSGTGNNSPVVGTGMEISSVFVTKLVRRQDLDNFTGSCWLKSADIHIEVDTVGSRAAFTK